MKENWPSGTAAQRDARTRRPGFAGESYTDYTYQVQVRIDDDTGDTTAFITSQGGEIGKPITARFADTVVAEAIGKTIMAEIRREHYGEEPEEVR